VQPGHRQRLSRPGHRHASGGSGVKGGSVTTVTLITGDRVRVTKTASGPQATAEAAPGRTGIAFGIERRGDSTFNAYKVTPPAKRCHLVSTSFFDVPLNWRSNLEADTEGEWGYAEYLPTVRYQPGEAATLKLSTAAFTPDGEALQYGGDNLMLDFRPFNSSGPGWSSSWGHPLTGDLVLERDGVRIATASSPFNISTENASGTATYKVIMHANRQVPWSVYTPKVSGTWTFTSTAPESGERVPPFISTKVSGPFDLHGRAPAGEMFPLTVGVTGAVGGVETVTVRVSYDEGKSWVSLPVSNETGEWVAKVRHPASLTNRFVALRVVATDARGNSGGWTAYRSYQLANLG
jgi:hypothetical protein